MVNDRYPNSMKKDEHVGDDGQVSFGYDRQQRWNVIRRKIRVETSEYMGDSFAAPLGDILR